MHGRVIEAVPETAAAAARVQDWPAERVDLIPDGGKRPPASKQHQQVVLGGGEGVQQVQPAVRAGGRCKLQVVWDVDANWGPLPGSLVAVVDASGFKAGCLLVLGTEGLAGDGVYCMEGG